MLDSSSDSEDDVLEMFEADAEGGIEMNLKNVEAEQIRNVNFNNLDRTFTAIMTKSNVNGSTHGVVGFFFFY